MTLPKAIFYPSGNADTCLIQLKNNRRIIFDYANNYDAENDDCKYIDLESEIRKAVGNEKKVTVLAISHLDRDHYRKVSDLFWLEYAEKYQGDDRIKIETLWVPAALILEEGSVKEEGRIIRAEARYRLKEGKGIRVFSNPNALDDWLEREGIAPEDRKNLITHAGNPAPEFDLAKDGVEFFVHSPFSVTGDEGEVVRNDSAIFMHVTFEVEEEQTCLILSADCPHEILDAIIRATKKHGNEARLVSDINNVAHHCSYRSLAEEKGDDKTEPNENIKWFYEQQGNRGCILISTSDPIPTEDTKQPPHRQAAAYYKDVAKTLKGEFLVTMEHPTKSNPKALVLEITGNGHRVKKSMPAPFFAVSNKKPPRAG